MHSVGWMGVGQTNGQTSLFSLEAGGHEEGLQNANWGRESQQGFIMACSSLDKTKGSCNETSRSSV